MGRRKNLPSDCNAPDDAWYRRWRERFRREGYPPEVVERKIANLLAARKSWELRRRGQ
jgi:hypothetical protein